MFARVCVSGSCVVDVIKGEHIFKLLHGEYNKTLKIPK